MGEEPGAQVARLIHLRLRGAIIVTLIALAPVAGVLAQTSIEQKSEYPAVAPPRDSTGAMHSLVDRLDTFRYGLQDPAGTDGPWREMLFLALGVALGFGLRPFAGRWPAALLAAAVAAFGSWLQYGFIVPYAAGAFVIVFFGWKHWLGKGGSTPRGG